MTRRDSGWSAVGRVIAEALRLSKRSRSPQSQPAQRTQPAQPSPRTQPGSTNYPGDFVGDFAITYQPEADQDADPGEVVWTWVPYEEDHSQGKDRPVLIVGRADAWLLACPLTSKDHDQDAAQEASEGRFWVDIGSGAWDTSGRASEVRVNRIIRVDPKTIRRISARLSQQRFIEVADGIRQHRPAG